MDYTTFNFLYNILPLEIIHIIDELLTGDYRRENAKKIAGIMKAVRKTRGAIFYEDTKIMYFESMRGELFTEKYVNGRFAQSTFFNFKNPKNGWGKKYAFTPLAPGGIVRLAPVTDREFEAEEED
nr:hypothetical protein K-LCC10_0308 [Kaumoebavirus]